MGAVNQSIAIPFRKVLVANRGEIAVRVIRTLRALGIRAVAVHSEADARALHVFEADEAVHIGGSEPRDSYLKVDAVIAAAVATKCDAVHPGYGFLSERADFARACETAGIVFVGPPAAVLEATGDKLGVKARVAKAGVPVIPGPLGPVGESAAALAAATRETGFPMLLKAIGGGGGRGLRRVDRAADAGPAAESARREAGGAFGDARLYAEALILPARHVEVQILVDGRGEVRVLGDRDCSLQRRHQKVIEEAPAPNLSDATRRTLHQAARDAAKALGYRNAGTCEFLVDPKGRPYFLEVNRRIQVEHPVTEAIFGIDLVEWQLRVAAGEPLPPEGTWTPRGHAIEARVCAEDPAKGFLPASGFITRLEVPAGPGIRVDGGFATHQEIPPYYDSMLMKVIASAETRAGAIARLDAALAETAVMGVASNVWFLRRLLADPDVVSMNLSTGHLDDHAERLVEVGPAPVEALLLASMFAWRSLHARREASGHRGDVRMVAGPWQSLRGWRLGKSVDLQAFEGQWSSGDVTYSVSARFDDARVKATIDGAPVDASIRASGSGAFELTIDGVRRLVYIDLEGMRPFGLFATGGRTVELRRVQSGAAAAHGAESSDPFAVSPMSGLVTKVHVSKGDRISKGAPLFAVEAMKMEYVVKAERDVVISEVKVVAGGRVTINEPGVTFVTDAVS